MRKLFIFMLVISISMIILTSCTKKEQTQSKLMYDPFTNIDVTTEGFNGNCTVSVNSDKVLQNNIDLINNDKSINADKKKLDIDLIQKVHDSSEYTVENNGTFRNKDVVKIKFDVKDTTLLDQVTIKPFNLDNSKNSNTNTGLNNTTNTLQQIAIPVDKNLPDGTVEIGYTINNLEMGFISSDLFTDSDYRKIQSSVLPKIKDNLHDKTISSIVYVGQYLVPFSEDGTTASPKIKSIVTVYTTVLSTKMTDVFIKHDYIYSYVVSDISYDNAGKAIVSDNSIKYITRNYQVSSVPQLIANELPYVKSESEVTPINQNNLKTFKNIIDLPNDALSNFNSTAVKNVTEHIKTMDAENTTITQYSFFKAYLLTYKYQDTADTRTSLVIIYKMSTLPQLDKDGKRATDTATISYSFSTFDFFLFDESGTLSSYDNYDQYIKAPDAIPNNNTIIKLIENGDVTADEVNMR